MGAAPLNWLAKIGGDTLKTKAKLLSSAINELYDDGQCKIVAVVDNTADNGKTVLITTDDNKTYSGTIANKKCEFLLPPKTLYTVQKVSSGSAEFTTKVEAGYGDCILVHLDTGYVEVKQGDIVGLDYIKAATADDLKNKVPEANAVKELNGKLKSIDTKIANITINAYARYKTEIINALNTYNAQIPSGICIVNFKPDSDRNYYSGVITQKINNTYGFGIVISYYNTETIFIRFDNKVWSNA